MRNACAEDLILQEELVQVLPKVNRANAMAKELRKNILFEIVLVAPQARGLKTGAEFARQFEYLQWARRRH